MTTNILVFNAQVNTLIQTNDDEFDSTSIDQQVKAAVERYSHDVPEEVVTDVAGDGGKYYAISSLTSFVDGFSRIVSIEYPAVTIANDDTPQYLSPGDWNDDYWASGTRYLFLPNHSPASTETMRIRYTAPYVWSGNATTTPQQHFFAICNLAASMCCQAIAVKYARTSDSTITGDSVDHAGRSERFASMATNFFTMYESQIGLSTPGGIDKQVAAGEFVDWNTRPSRDRDYLFHRNR